MSACLVCGNEASRRAGRGRPPRYCLSCQGRARSRLERGLCVRCAEPKAEGSPLCSQCHARASEEAA